MNALEKLLSITPYNVKNLLNGTWNKFKKDSSFLNLDEDIQEQVLYRAMLCQRCESNGECLYCGCTTPDMFYAADKVDSQLKWGPMLEAEDWEVFKNQNFYNTLSFDLAFLNNTNMLSFNVLYNEKLSKWDGEYIFINFIKYKFVKIDNIDTTSSNIAKCSILVEANLEDYKNAVKRVNLLQHKGKSSEAVITDNSGKKYSTDNITSDNVVFESTSFDFGFSNDNVVTGAFFFKNVSDKNVRISSCQATCGCTIPTFTKESITPNENGIIQFTVNLKEKKGNVKVTIIAGILDESTNKLKQYTLQISGKVKN